MTVICWDGESLHADKRGAYCARISVVTKIGKTIVPEGHNKGVWLVGVSGPVRMVSVAIDWIQSGCQNRNHENYLFGGKDTALILAVQMRDRDATPVVHFYRDSIPEIIESDPPYAIGANAREVMTGILLGHTFKEALVATAKYSVLVTEAHNTLTFQPEDFDKLEESVKLLEEALITDEEGEESCL